MNDARAFVKCTELWAWLKNLPEECFLVADNAHPLSNKVLIPFSRAAKHPTCNRSFNFHLSQLQMQVEEMAFGLLTTKWRIFWQNLDVQHVPHLQLICGAAANSTTMSQTMTALPNRLDRTTS